MEHVTVESSNLGEFGRSLARRVLEDKGFTVIGLANEDLKKRKFSFGSFLAIKGRRKYLIEVKTRNKYKRNGSLNTRYKWDNSRGVYSIARKYEALLNAKAHWMSVQIDTKNNSYSVYFGSLAELGSRSGVPMRESAVTSYECLIDNRTLPKAFIPPENINSKKSALSLEGWRADRILEAMEPASWTGLYILGCFDRRITFYSQQARALTLIRGLFDTGVLSTSKRVAVVGAGAAGVTAAVAAARLGCRVTLFEKLDAILHLQAAAGHRFLHPHLYDWPEYGCLDVDAGLPLMNWKANLANQVVTRQLRPEFEKQQHRCGTHLTFRPATTITNIASQRPPFRIHWNHGLDHCDVDAVLLAIGFGIDGPPSYWNGDSLAGPHAGGLQKILISGTGDGGLVDLARAALRSGDQESEFRHDQAVQQLTTNKDFKKLGNEMRLVDDDARSQYRKTGNAMNLFEQYKRMVTKKDLKEVVERIRQHIYKLRRTDTDVTLNFHQQGVFVLESSLMNRLLAFLLLETKLVKPMQGKIEELAPPTPLGKILTTVVDAGEHTLRGEFDLVVQRHGPEQGYFEKQFPFLNGARKVLGGKLANLGLTGTLEHDTIKWYKDRLQLDA